MRMAQLLPRRGREAGRSDLKDAEEDQKDEEIVDESATSMA